MKCSTVIKTTICAFAFLVATQFVNAQPGGPGGPGPDPDPNPPSTAVPVDLGLSLFVAAGLGYAIKRQADKKAAQKDSIDK